MRMRKKKNLEARMEVCAALWVKDRCRCGAPGGKRCPVRGCSGWSWGAARDASRPRPPAPIRMDLYVAVERVPDAMVIAMERCRDMGLTNVFFIDGDAACLSDYFAPDEVDLLYINFCDPWPSVKHARRRLTYETFLRGYRKVLRDGGRIDFKTDNHDLFEWSLFQFPKAGYQLSRLTADLHANGVQGVMTDYEEKFYQLGTPINRCVGTKVELPDVPVLEGLRCRLRTTTSGRWRRGTCLRCCPYWRATLTTLPWTESCPAWIASGPTCPLCRPGVSWSRSTMWPSGGRERRRRCWIGWRATPGSGPCGWASSW